MNKLDHLFFLLPYFVFYFFFWCSVFEVHKAHSFLSCSSFNWWKALMGATWFKVDKALSEMADLLFALWFSETSETPDGQQYLPFMSLCLDITVFLPSAHNVKGEQSGYDVWQITADCSLITQRYETKKEIKWINFTRITYSQTQFNIQDFIINKNWKQIQHEFSGSTPHSSFWEQSNLCFTGT